MATPFETAITKNLLSHNEAYVSSSPSDVGLPLPPAKKYAVVTCMDARLAPTDPAKLGIAPGDAHVIRNAGGSAREALRSLLISQHLLGTEEVVLIKHTGCGMLTFKDDDARELIAGRQGGGGKDDDEVRKVVDGIDFLTFPDLEEEVKRDVEFLRASKALRARERVSGWVWEVETGRVRRVV